MQLFMIVCGTDLDKIEYVVAEHEPDALYRASKVLGMSKLEMTDIGYRAILVPNETLNGYEVKTKKSKVTTTV